jgi:4-amino-4-deoxy-L-arabinose transferase-like glycosyltransferase
MVANPRIWWRLVAAVVLGAAAVLFFARLGERSLWSEEVRWAEIPREMARAGDYFWPTFNGRVYYDKPLGSYWLVLGVSRVTGTIDELTARLPSAISGLMGVVLVMLLAKRLYGRRVAVLAGAILSTSFGCLVFARTAAADMENLVGVLAALWLFVRNDGRPGGRWPIAFWLVMAVTSLTKGLLGFALPLLVASVYSTWTGLADGRSDRGWIKRVVVANGWLLNRTTLVAAPLAAAVYLTPFFLSHGGLAEGLGMVYRENLRRFYDPVNHRGPVYLYAYVIFMLLAPWSLLLPAALVHGHVSQNRGDRFALTYFWAIFVFFTLSASRRSYYLLPILPAGALLIAALLVRPANWLPRTARWLRFLGVGLFAAVVLAVPAVLLPPALRPAPFDQFPPLPAPTAFIAAWAVSAIALALTAIQPSRVGIALAVTAFALQGYAFVFAQSATDADRTQRAFADAVRQRVGSDLVLYRTREIVYYLDPPGPLPEFDQLDELRRAVERREVRWVVLRRRDREPLGSDWTEVLTESIGPWDAADRAGTKLLLLRVP